MIVEVQLKFHRAYDLEVMGHIRGDDDRRAGVHFDRRLRAKVVVEASLEDGELCPGLRSKSIGLQERLGDRFFVENRRAPIGP